MWASPHITRAPHSHPYTQDQPKLLTKRVDCRRPKVVRRRDEVIHHTTYMEELFASSISIPIGPLDFRRRPPPSSPLPFEKRYAPVFTLESPSSRHSIAFRRWHGGGIPIEFENFLSLASPSHVSRTTLLHSRRLNSRVRFSTSGPAIGLHFNHPPSTL